MSDAHTWNLVFLQLLIEELGLDVVNLGPCVPVELLVRECHVRQPALIALSSVNGHGYQDGLQEIAALRACAALTDTPIVIGGKLGVSDIGRTDRAIELLKAGFDAVYDDHADDAARFRSLVSSLAVIES
ncbi:cobalamin B12-binding domain-containing protein [Amycolatopsis sp. NPDC054798]